MPRGQSKEFERALTVVRNVKDLSEELAEECGELLDAPLEWATKK